MKRLVRVKNSFQSGIQTHEVDNVNTFGELVQKLNLDIDGMRVVVRETRNTLEHDDAILPDGDFTLYIMPSKTKSGANYEDMGFHELRKLCRERGLHHNHKTRLDLIESLHDYDDDLDFLGNDDDEDISFDDAKGRIIDLLNIIINKVKKGEVPRDKYESLYKAIEEDFSGVKDYFGVD